MCIFFGPQAAMRTGAFLALPAPPLESLGRAPVCLCWTYAAQASWQLSGFQYVCHLCLWEWGWQFATNMILGWVFPFPLPVKQEIKKGFKTIICLYVLQQGSICEDIMVTCCCIWCSWCQMSREIKARKQTFTVLTTHSVFQPISMATTTQVISTQQSVGVIDVAPVAFGPAAMPSVTTFVR